MKVKRRARIDPCGAGLLRASSFDGPDADDWPMRGIRATACAMALSTGVTLATVASSGVAPAIATPRVAMTSSTQTLAPGLTLTKITDPAGPWILRVLTIDPSKPPTIDIATAGGEIGSYARTSVIGDTRGALAAINGDFTVSRAARCTRSPRTEP